MLNPPHPGRIVRQECLAPLSLSVTDAANAVGVSHNALSEPVNERRGVSPKRAIRLSKAFGGSAETWHGMQAAYDMAQAMKLADQIKVRRVVQPTHGAYHHAKLVQAWLARSGCRIKLHFVPAYCPHLHPNAGPGDCRDLPPTRPS